MSTVRATAVRRCQSCSGFSLIELLVVIAIIALLAALLFPAFAAVREKGRQATALSNLHEIQVGMAQYQLDHHAYPAALFGYVTATGTSMADHASVTGGLYPQYVNNYQAFMDPNNSVTDPTAQTAALPVYTLDSSGALTTTTTQKFFQADAFDVSPEVTGTNAMDTTKLVPRYQLNWTSLTGTTSPPSGVTTQFYQRQLRWRSIPGDTYVTCTTYHVQNADKVIVLYESGAAKVLDSSKFLSPGADVATLSAVSGVSNANFWKVQP